MPRRLLPLLAAFTLPFLAPAAAQAAGITLEAERVLRDGARPVAMAGHTFVLRGRVEPYVAGQQVKIRMYKRGRKFRVLTRNVQPGGRFTAELPAGRPGRLTIRAAHLASAQQGALESAPARIRIARPTASDPTAIRVLQQRLARLRYAVPRSRVYDGGTARAVIAYRKVNGMARLGGVTSALFARLARKGGGFQVRHPRHGHHIEADLSRQVLALIDGRKVRRIYHTSSGAPATPTIRGTFRVYRKDPGTNALGMVHSAYFRGGYAIHGYASVPTYNASHGCLRVPIPDARRIYDWLSHGDIVDVYL